MKGARIFPAVTNLIASSLLVFQPVLELPVSIIEHFPDPLRIAKPLDRSRARSGHQRKFYGMFLSNDGDEKGLTGCDDAAGNQGFLCTG
jgi:hypothetical protein